MDRDITLIHDMLRPCIPIMSKSRGLTAENFEADEDIQDIVIRQIAIIGEAANLLSEEFRARHRNIPWHEIRGMRNRLVHDYSQVNYVTIWHTITHDIPELKRRLESITE